ncbi:flavin reductase domain protein FMN-binding protein [Thermodesulfatator indicus DSM 15286]|uniref:Flavin reductase domain protein FMN-binding protein n=1 Tax=Thermodesulfatator indicus (strain DSM 15286 / JCM 11887 / CIR29812) TaxID=667014 RepID=F8AC02_THEID|nr:flavin reductase family protein [Thermodesulfatator indicus]AEH45700.1 flavin reductase domain protein FMN-binding protein [Thermodesulfatator indicus DSM 15286]
MGLQSIITKYIPQGVFVVTVREGKIINGMTAAWVGQVSFRPKLLSVSIAPQRYTYDLIKSSGIFCINVLGEGQLELAKHFGFKSGREVNKFEGIDYMSALNGSPVLKDAIAYFECKVFSTCDAGDHVLFIGEVIDHAVLKEGVEPLIFRWDDFFGGRG